MIVLAGYTGMTLDGPERDPPSLTTLNYASRPHRRPLAVFDVIHAAIYTVTAAGALWAVLTMPNDSNNTAPARIVRWNIIDIAWVTSGLLVCMGVGRLFIRPRSRSWITKVATIAALLQFLILLL